MGTLSSRALLIVHSHAGLVISSTWMEVTLPPRVLAWLYLRVMQPGSEEGCSKPCVMLLAQYIMQSHRRSSLQTELTLWVQVPGSFMVPVEVVVDTLMSTDFSQVPQGTDAQSPMGPASGGLLLLFCMLTVCLVATSLQKPASLRLCLCFRPHAAHRPEEELHCRAGQWAGGYGLTL